MSLLSEVISGEQAQAQAPRDVQDQKMKVAQFLQQKKLNDQALQMGDIGLQKARQPDPDTIGANAFVNFLATQSGDQGQSTPGQAQPQRPSVQGPMQMQPGMSPGQSQIYGRMKADNPNYGMSQQQWLSGGGQQGPNVSPAPVSQKPAMAKMSLDTLVPSLVKQNPGLAKNPKALAAAIQQFQPMLDEASKTRVAAAAEAAKVAASGVIEQNKKQADADVKKQEAQPKAQAQLTSFLDNETDAQKTIDDVAKQSNAWTTGFMGGVGKHVPGTPAYDLAANVSRLQSRLGLDTLSELKNNSPNGSALGRVTNYEMGILVNAKANLDQAQSKSQFDAALQDLKVKIANSKKHVKEAYDETYGGGKQVSQSKEFPSTATENGTDLEAGAGPISGIKTVDFNDWK